MLPDYSVMWLSMYFLISWYRSTPVISSRLPSLSTARVKARVGWGGLLQQARGWQSHTRRKEQGAWHGQLGQVPRQLYPAHCMALHPQPASPAPLTDDHVAPGAKRTRRRAHLADLAVRHIHLLWGGGRGNWKGRRCEGPHRVFQVTLVGCGRVLARARAGQLHTWLLNTGEVLMTCTRLFVNLRGVWGKWRHVACCLSAAWLPPACQLRQPACNPCTHRYLIHSRRPIDAIVSGA